MTATIAPTAPTREPVLATAALEEAVAGPVLVDLGVPVATVPLPLDPTEVTRVLLLFEEIVATEEATGAVVVALTAEETTPFPLPWPGVRPPVGTAELEPEPEPEPADDGVDEGAFDEGPVLEEEATAAQLRS